MTADHTAQIAEILNDPALTDAEKLSQIRDLSRPTMEGVPWDTEEHYLREAEYRSGVAVMIAPHPGEDVYRIMCHVPGTGPTHIRAEDLRPTPHRYNLRRGTGTTYTTGDTPDADNERGNPETAPSSPATDTTDRSGTSALFETFKPSQATTRPKKYLTIPQAAELCGRSRGHLEDLAKGGHLHVTDAAEVPSAERAATRYTTEEDLIAAGLLDSEGRKGFTISEAARILGMSRSSVVRRVKSGEFRSICTKDPKAVPHVVIAALPAE